MPDWEISIPSYGRLLLEFCEALGVRDCAVVGNSMGGFVAAEAAIAEPDRFEKLVLVSAAGVSSARLRREPTEVAARMLAAGAPLCVQPAGARASPAAGASDRLSQHLPPPRRAAPGAPLGVLRTAACAARGSSRRSAALAGYDFLDRLDEVEVPTLIVWGRQDHVVPPADALEYGRLLRTRAR